MSEAGATIPGVTADNINQFILELLRAAVDGTLQSSKIPLALRATGVEISESLSKSLADAIWLVSIEIEDKADDVKDRLKDVALACLKEQMVSINVVVSVFKKRSR